MTLYATNISTKVTYYLNSLETTYLLEIKKDLEQYFVADESCLFLYNRDKLTLKDMFSGYAIDKMVTKGLINEAIDTSSVLCLDRVNSHKLYYQEVDNIHQIKIKSILIVPIEKDNVITGVFVLYRKTSHSKPFTLENVNSISLFLPSFQRLTKVMEKNGKNHSRNIPRLKVDKQKKTTIKSNKKKSQCSELELEVKALKSVLNNLKKENKTLHAHNDKFFKLQDKVHDCEEKYNALQQLHSTSVAEYKERLLKQKEEITQLQVLNTMLEQEKIAKNTIEDAYKNLVRKYDKLVEKSLIAEAETKKTIEKYQKEYKELKLEYEKKIDSFPKKIVDLSQKETPLLKNVEYTSDITEVTLLENRLEYCKIQVKELEEEKNKLEKQYKEDINAILLFGDKRNDTQNIGNILCKVNTKFNNNKYAYMFFELILYALESEKTLSFVNTQLMQTKLIFDILETYHLPITEKNSDESYKFSYLLDNIKLYEKKLFPKSFHIKIVKDKFIPESLHIDMPKIQSIIYYLLMDFSSFIDMNHQLTIKINHNKSFIYFDIAGKVADAKSSFITFYTKNPVKDISQRPELQFAIILLKSLGMDIKPLYKGKDYRLSFSVPYEKIA